MKGLTCPELCLDCPLASQIPAPRVLEQSDNSRIVSIEPDIVRVPGRGTTISFDFEHGIPIQPHKKVVEVGILSDGSDEGLGFWVNESLGLSGVARAFEACNGPKNVRKGFLKLGKEAVCGAVLDFAEKS